MSQLQRGLLDALVPARFFLTAGHLVATVMIMHTKRENLLAGLPVDPSTSRYDRAKAEVRIFCCREITELQFEAALAISLICFLFDMIGIFFGTSLLFVKVDLLNVVCHFAGGILVASMIQDSWQYQYIWYANV